MKILKLDSENTLKETVDVLRKGGVIIYPTDTLYGIGCDATNEKSIGRIFHLKKRSKNMPLSIAVSDMEMFGKYGELASTGKKLAEEFLPGGLTLIVGKKNLPDILTADGDTVAIRIPDLAPILEIISELGKPIITTSANISGKRPPISIQEAMEQIPDGDLYIDGGKLKKRSPSTIIQLTGEPVILREGAIKREEIEGIIGKIKIKEP